VRYFAWHLLRNQVLTWSTQLGKGLSVLETVMKSVVMLDGKLKRAFDVGALKQAIAVGWHKLRPVTWTTHR
jgi:hypothetical protein